MTPERLLIVGPAGARTGGIARYISEQRDHLADGLATAVHDTYAGYPQSHVEFALAALGAVVGVVRFALRRPPDVVHVHTSQDWSFYRNAVYVLFATYVWRRPVVLHVHGSSFDEFLATDSPLVSALQSRVLGASERIVVLSEYWRDVLAERVDPEKLTVLPNAVPAEEYDPTFERERPHVVFLSNHIERKGVREFVAAVERLQDGDVASFDVTVAGYGPLSDLSERLAEEYAAVDYVGYVEEAEKRRLLSDATIYVLPAYAEGLPIAILEAMAGGDAVVSTAVGSIPEVVGPDNGRVVEPKDVDGLTAALRELVEDPALARSMGERNRALVAERYSWAATAEELRRIYGDCAG